MYEARLPHRLTIHWISSNLTNQNKIKPVIPVVAMRCYAAELAKVGKLKATKRMQKPNFSAAECTLILQLAEENIETICKKFSSSLTNKKKNYVWQTIAECISAIGVAKRTPNDIREKWRAMKIEARKDLGKEQMTKKKKQVEESLRIIEVFGN